MDTRLSDLEQLVSEIKKSRPDCVVAINYLIGMFTSKVQEDKVDVELPDIDALIKENTSDEFIEKKINDLEILETTTHPILKDVKSLDPDISQLVDKYFWYLV